MRTPPPAYFLMRATYARWFWKLPAGLVLLALAMVLGRTRSHEAGRLRRGAWQSFTPLVFAAATAFLLDSVKDRAVYEVNRGIYQSTPDQMP